MTTVQVRADTTAILESLRSLAEIGKVSPETLQRLLGDREVCGELFQAHSETAREGELLIVFEPSDRLRDFLSASRASQLDR